MEKEITQLWHRHVGIRHDFKRLEDILFVVRKNEFIMESSITSSRRFSGNIMSFVLPDCNVINADVLPVCMLVTTRASS